ncbi:MAG: ribonuclease H-like domain-containing protein [Planctomycetes bacterium]|nr:ribonuclease H-like domain-containing protein [Planctomycetota bacterium]
MVAPDRDKLRRVFKVQDRTVPPPEAAPPADASRPEVRAFLQRRFAGFVKPRSKVALPAGEEIVTPHGPLWRRRLCYPWSHPHGERSLAAARDADPARVAALGRLADPAAVQQDRVLFLDTETTGLAGGAGTVVFAFGVAFLTTDGVVLEQAFLRDFGEEPALLSWFAEHLAARPVPVTFVGKSFDRHRIAARLLVHKQVAPVLTERHLDLYHIARRQWGKELSDVRLRTVEECKLGLWRDDDLPGSEAPAAFFDWIRDGTGPIDRVLEHNRLDVLSLVAIWGLLGA